MTKKYLGPKYPTPADGKIPAFNSYEDEANFWDTHSVTEFLDQLEDVEMVVELNKPCEETLILRVQKSLKQKLEQLAAKKGLNSSSLARILLAEKLQVAI